MDKELSDKLWEANELPDTLGVEELTYFVKYHLRNGNIKVNFNGHLGINSGQFITLEESGLEYNRSYSHIYDKLCDSMSWVIIKCDKSGELLGSILNGEKLNEPLYINSDKCGHCGQKLAYWFNGQNFEVTHLIRSGIMGFNYKESSHNPTCTEFGGLKDYFVEVDIPSGELVFANDFRRLTPAADKNRSINYDSEVKKMVEDYAEHNVLMAFVGNSCPGVYDDGNGALVVGNPGYNEEDEEINPLGHQLGSICTDLWWFSAMDKDQFNTLKKEYLDSGGTEDYTVKDWPEIIVAVKPGRYRMKVFTNPTIDGKDYSNGEKFVEIKRIT